MPKITPLPAAIILSMGFLDKLVREFQTEKRMVKDRKGVVVITFFATFDRLLKLFIMNKSVRLFLVAFSQLYSSHVKTAAAKKITNANPVNTSQACSHLLYQTDGPAMSFDKTTHDFGTIEEGEKVTTQFSFTNTGKSDLNYRRRSRKLWLHRA